MTLVCEPALGAPDEASSPPGSSLQLQTPPGFSVALAAGTPAIRFPMFAAFDERGRLFVAESAGGDLYDELRTQTRRCRISMLEDRDGDGRFERARVFAEQLVFPMGLAWHAGKLYVADPPDLVTLEDIDADGRADRRVVILTGFGHTDNGSLHGLTFGPDGWLYLTMGAPDGYRLRRPDGTVLEGRSGALLRCRPDGSDAEVICRGFENLVEIAFLPADEIIGTDNWFQMPDDGMRDALVHLIEGGLYPYAPDEGTPQVITGDALPALALYPAAALSGLALYRGSVFPGRMNLFSAQHNSRKVVRHQLERNHSTFRSQDQDFLWTDDPDFHPSDVLEDADGSLLVIDTGSWYVHHCPTGRIRQSPALGGIWRVRPARSPLVRDPRGAQLDWNTLSPDQLAQRLSDDRPVVRDRAADALAVLGENAVATLRALLESDGARFAKTEAIRVLARINTETARKTLRSRLQGEDADSIALAARAAGRGADTNAAPQLLALLEHSAGHVQLAAAEALAHCGNRGTVSLLADRLARDTDPFLEHALVFALHRLASVEQLHALLNHSSPRVQRAALLLLDQPPRRVLPAEAVSQRAFSEDEVLRRTAQSILRKHPDWVAQALPVLERLLAAPAPTPGELESVRSFVLAFCNDAQVAAMAARAVAADSRDELRVALLDAISGAARDPLPPIWRETMATALSSPSAAVRAQALRTINALRLEGFDDALASVAGDQDATDGLRVEALRALARGQSALDDDAFAILFRQLSRTNNALGRLTAAEISGGSRLNARQFARFVEAVDGDPMISPALVLAALPRAGLTSAAADALLNYLRNCLAAGWQFSEQQFQALETAIPSDRQTHVKVLRESSDQAAQRQREQLTALAPLLRGGDAARGQGVFAQKAGCATCHRVTGQGGVIGPDLTKIGAVRAGRDLIESMVMPSATFAQGYETYSVTLRNGDTLTGIRVRQADDSLVLRDASGAQTRIASDQATRVERQKLSLMPEGLLNALNESEIRDLLAYLQSLK